MRVEDQSMQQAMRIFAEGNVNIAFSVRRRQQMKTGEAGVVANRGQWNGAIGCGPSTDISGRNWGWTFVCMPRPRT